MSMKKAGKEELESGTEELESGTEELESGTEELESGTEGLESGTESSATTSIYGESEATKTPPTDPDSQYTLASRYVKKGRWNKAVNYFSLAAEQGHTDALMALSVCFAEGVGAPKNIGLAIHYCQLALKRKNMLAHHYLGGHYEMSDDNIEPDLIKAIHHHSLAIENGCNKSLQPLTNLLENEGVSSSIETIRSVLDTIGNTLRVLQDKEKKILYKKVQNSLAVYLQNIEQTLEFHLFLQYDYLEPFSPSNNTCRQAYSFQNKEEIQKARALNQTPSNLGVRTFTLPPLATTPKPQAPITIEYYGRRPNP